MRVLQQHGARVGEPHPASVLLHDHDAEVLRQRLELVRHRRRRVRQRLRRRGHRPGLRHHAEDREPSIDHELIVHGGGSVAIDALDTLTALTQT